MNNIEAMSKAIREIVRLKGNQVFGSSKLFCAMLDDMVPELAKERKVFRRVLDDKLLAEIGRLFNDASVHKNVGWERVRQKLTEDYGFQKEWCNIVVDSFSGDFAEQGNVADQNKLGDMYWAEKDYAKAFECYKRSAEQGNAVSQCILGVMYEAGYGTDENYVEAFKWYKKSAEQGNADAQNSLGNMYYNGDGTEKDYLEALKWYKKAAEQGDTYAKAMLGAFVIS